MVLLEALASGCRVVTTNLPGTCELLEKASRDLLDFIPLPKMDRVDRPNPEDREQLETALVQSLIRMVEQTMTKPSPDQQEVSKIVAPHAWSAVYERIDASYERALDT